MERKQSLHNLWLSFPLQKKVRVMVLPAAAALAAAVALIALAVVGALKGQLKQAAQQSTAHSYIHDGSFYLDVNTDHFLYESTTRRKIENNEQRQ